MISRIAFLVNTIAFLAIQNDILCRTVDEEFTNILPTKAPRRNTMGNCSLVVQEIPTYTGNQKIEIGDIHLVTYNLKVVNESERFAFDKMHQSLLFQPFKFVMTTGPMGRLLLMLGEFFDPMSLYTLDSYVANKLLEVTEEPKHCLKAASVEDVENTFRSLIVNNFGDNISISSGKELCNRHIDVKENIGTLKYVCCKRGATKTLVCYNLKTSIPVSLLFKLMFAGAILVVLYSPWLIFRRFCTFDKYLNFVYKPKENIKVNSLLVASNADLPDDGFERIRMSSSNEFSSLKEGLSSLQKGMPNHQSVQKLHMRVLQGQVVSTGDSPVTFIRFLRDVFWHCQTTNDLCITGTCCHENMFKMYPCCYVPWKCLLRCILTAFGILLLTTPWLMRLLFFYKYEEVFRKGVDHKLNFLGLTSHYQGSLVLYLSPTHSVFITIYCILPLNLIIYCALPKTVKQRLRQIVKECFKMKNNPTIPDALSTFVAHIFWPFMEFGIIGALVFPLWLLVIPLELTVLLYRIIPVFNVIIRLAINCACLIAEENCPKARSYGKKHSSVCGNFIQWFRRVTGSIRVNEKREDSLSPKFRTVLALSLILCLLSLLATFLLFLEIMTFYAKCILYVIIGILLNGERYFKFLVLAAFFIWHCYDSFDHVRNKFKALTQHASEILMTQVETFKEDGSSLYDNVAVAVDRLFTENDGENITFVLDAKGNLNAVVKYPLFIIDRSSKLFIPKDYILKTASISNLGSVYQAYLYAFVDLMCRTIFLGFVLLVVLAIDDSHNTYGIHLSIFSVLGGLLPCFFRKCVMNSYKSEFFLRNGFLIFSENMNSVLKGYTQSYRVVDMEVDKSVPAVNSLTTCRTEDSKAVCALNVDNGHHLERQISDVIANRLIFSTYHLDNDKDDTDNTPLIRKSGTEGNITMIAVLTSDETYDYDFGLENQLISNVYLFCDGCGETVIE